MEIDIWSDIACPWCFIGLTRFQRVLDGFEHRGEVSVRLHSYQLDPALPESFDGTEADYLAASKQMPKEQVEHMVEQVRAAGATEGLVLDFDALRVANSRRAHRLLHAARIEDQHGHSVHRLKIALLKAHFTDGESIADHEVLVRLAVDSGLAEEAARQAVGDGPIAEKLDQAVQNDMNLAGQLGIQGVPFFVLANKYGISGAQPAEVFEQALAQVWGELHPRVQPLAVAGLEGLDASGPACGPDGCA
ncbi:MULTISPECIES: DsbA family oxidoreductase [unclassified Luteococcus]|uniref:DsbA family oxidoreductase n=1 Tax=unclassified Luteococcus TaxID=2639923 RepID=UPI00313D951A